MRKRDYREDAKKALVKTRLLREFSYTPRLINTPRLREEGQRSLIERTHELLRRMYDEGGRR